MTDPQPATLCFGDVVSCSDGTYGELADVVIDPEAGRITHLVVQPHHHPGRSKLMPIGLLGPGATSGGIVLRCTVAQAHELEPVQELTYMTIGEDPPDDPQWDVGVQDVFPMPHYEAGAFIEYSPDPAPEIVRMYDRIPKGEVEIRHSSSVTTADGRGAGLAEGFVMSDGRITHLLLRRGFWWRRRRASVPVADVERFETDDIVLRLSDAALKKLFTERVSRSG
jgi:hypothetical protein